MVRNIIRKHSHIGLIHSIVFSTFSQINPGKLSGAELYNFTKGAKTIALSPVQADRRTVDGLHLDINVKETFKKIALRTMVTCPENSDFLPEEMVNPSKVAKLDKEDAEVKWRQNDLLVTNYMPSASKQVQNPGG